MSRRSFRTAVLASALAFQAQGRVMPKRARRVGQKAANRVMKWLDARRERLDEQAFGTP